MALLTVIAVGGAAGSCLRYGAGLLWPAPAGAFPWTTVTVNVAGCSAMGVLMGVLTSGRATHPLVRPFLGVGVLGGFTTFSTCAVEARALVSGGRAGMALAYLGITVLGTLVGVSAALRATRLALRRSAAPRAPGSGQAPGSAGQRTGR